MTTLAPKANDFVAEKLGLTGWWSGTRDVYPNLLANPWLLVTALWKMGLSVTFLSKTNEVGIAGVYYSPIIDGDLATALLQAAFQMLSQENPDHAK